MENSVQPVKSPAPSAGEVRNISPQTAAKPKAAKKKKARAPSGKSRRHTVVAIIPLYNGAPFIEEAVKSVLAQSRPADEIVVVNDGSTDGGPAIVQRLAAKFPKIQLVHKTNGGQASARNFGVSVSTSSLIALLDQDDAWYPHHLERLIKPFEAKEQHRPIGWVYSNLDEVDEAGSLVSRSFLHMVQSEHPKRHLIQCLRGDMFVLPSASLISREAFKAIGGFDERLSGYEDDDLFLRLFRANYENVFVDEPLSMWRIYPTSTSYTPRMAKSRMIYAKKLFDEYPNDPKRHRFFQRDLIAPRFLGVLLAEYRKSLHTNNREVFTRVVKDFEVVLPHLEPMRRRNLARVMPLMSNYYLARAAFVMRKPLHPLIARLGVI